MFTSKTMFLTKNQLNEYLNYINWREIKISI